MLILGARAASGEEIALGNEPIFRAGTDTMVWEDPRTRLSPTPATTYASLIEMARNNTCPPNADSVYGRRSMHNCDTDEQACTTPQSSFGLSTIDIPNIGSRQALQTTITAGGEKNSTWLVPFRYDGTHDFSYSAGAEIILDFWFQFVSGTIGSSGSKWFEIWNRGLNSRIQTSNTNGSFGLGCWDQSSDDDPVAAGMFARTPFYLDGGVGTVGYMDSGTVQKWTVVYKPESHCLVYHDGVKIIALADAYVNQTPAGGDKVWCTQAEVDEAQAIDDDIDYTKMMDVFNSEASAAVIRFTPVRCWTRPTDFGPGSP